MPTYTYRCRECDPHRPDTAEFDLSRPMSESSEPARCPRGHTDTVKLLNTVPLAGRAAVPAPSGGGCCGGGCCS